MKDKEYWKRAIKKKREKYERARCVSLIYMIIMDEVKIEYQEKDSLILDSISGGLGIDEICGAYLGGIISMAVMSIHNCSPEIICKVRLMLISELMEKLQALSCHELIKKYVDCEGKCDIIIIAVLSTVEKICIENNIWIQEE